jgi:hypothetical protein
MLAALSFVLLSKILLLIPARPISIRPVLHLTYQTVHTDLSASNSYKSK